MPCIGLFFMVSGALLLPVKDAVTQQGLVSFLSRRFSKITVPIFFWTIFYLTIIGGGKSVNANVLISVLFSVQGHSVLWFMYTLAGLYLIAPIISPWLEKASKGMLRIYLALWLVSLLYPLLDLFLVIDTSPTGPLYYLSGYEGYFVLGFYLRRYGSDGLPKSIVLVAGGVLATLAPAVCKICHWEVDFYRMFWYLSIFSFLMCLCYWEIVRRLCTNVSLKVKNLLQGFSNLSFGIYLSHIFIARNVLWKCDFICHLPNYYLQTALLFLITLAGSLGVCYLLSFLPKSEYIIGYTRNKKSRS